MSTYSTSLRLELIANGAQVGNWGDTTNNNLGTLLEQAITGVTTITMVDADYTLSNLNGTSDEARNAVLYVGGANTAIKNLIAPLVEKTYWVYNGTTGGYNIIVKASTGTGVSIPNGAIQAVYCDGTNFYAASVPYAGSTGTGNVVLSASPTLTGTPVAPTAAAGTNTTQIATTAFVATAVGTPGTMASQNANNVAITGGTITGTTINSNTVGSNSVGARTVSSSSPTGGSDGDIWYKI